MRPEEGLRGKRMKEFVWYHLHGDGDCNGQALRAYAQSHLLQGQDCFDLAYFYSVTYCTWSAVYLLGHRAEIHSDPAGCGREFSRLLKFQSDRKYARMRDMFSKILTEWAAYQSRFYPGFAQLTLDAPGVVNTQRALEEIQHWFFFKRYGAYLFLETYCDIFGLQASRADGLRYDGDQMTFEGGLFRAFGMDGEADFVDANKRLPVSAKRFEALLHELQDSVRAAGGDDSLVKLETSLCAYDKFFKGTRYNGFYADRQLAELNEAKEKPEAAPIVRELFAARAAAIDDQYLGERHGWDGVRKELKKAYRETGAIPGYPG